VGKKARVRREIVEHYREGIARVLGIKPEEVNPKVVEKYKKAMDKLLSEE
jgi:hypothetical protein